MKNKKVFVLVVSLLIIIFIVTISVVDRCAKKDNAVCTIKAGHHKIKAVVAYTSQAQAKGLMGLADLKDGEGMIFVYDSPQQLSFWMKNTIIPLSIAFIEADGRIAVIYDMKTEIGVPDFVLPTYASPTEVKYAIEVPQGWFAAKGIKASDQMDLPKELK